MSSIHDILREINGEVDKSVAPNWDQLQLAAKEFLKELKNYKTKKTQISKNKQRLKNTKADSIEDVASIKQQVTSLNLQEQINLKNLYNKLFVFDAILNRYLGETLKRSGVYVDISVDGKTIQTYVVSLEELVDSISYEGKIYNTFGNKSTIENLAQGDDKIHIETGATVVSEIIDRLNKFYDKINNLKASFNEKKEGKVYKEKGKWKSLSTQRQGGLLLWQQSNDWKAATITNLGVVSEAYVNFLFTEHNSIQDYLCKSGANIEDKIDIFYTRYLQSVTNQSALIEEDVIVDGIGQYAVKKEKATLPQISQYEKTANQIIKGNTNMSPAKLKEWIKEKFNKTAKLAPLKKSSGQALTDSIPDDYIGVGDDKINIGDLMRKAAMQIISEDLSN